MPTPGRFDPEATACGDPYQTPRTLHRAPGARVDRYVITDQIGVGAMGVVYRAHDPSLDRVVALKLLHPSSRTDRRRSARLLSEAKALARLSGPNVVNVYDLGTVGEELYIAMEFVDGTTLDAWLDDSDCPPSRILEVFRQAARGLAAAHAAGLVHGDFKPTNVMVDDAGRAKVLDFGLAQQGDLTDSHSDADQPSASPTPSLVGTPAYMAPEQFEGHAATAQSDQFSFCVALWEALYGARPFGGATLYELAASVIDGEISAPPSKSAVPRWLHRVLVRGLARGPERRWPSMSALLTELDADRTRARRVVTLTGAGVIAALGWGWMQTQPDERSRCTNEASGAVSDWAHTDRAALHEAIMASPEAYTATTARTAEAQLDGYLAEWRETYVATCLAPRTMPDAIRVRAYACLDARRRRLDALLKVLTAPDANPAETAVQAIGGLHPIGPCSDAAYLQKLQEGAQDPALERALVTERERLAEADALRSVGQYAASRELAITVVERSETLEFGPLVAEANASVAATLLEMGRYDEAEPHFRRAYATAVAIDLPAFATVAALGMMGLETSAGDYPQAREWAFHTKALLERPGTAPSLRGNFHARLGRLDGAEQRVDDAIANLRTALQISESEHGPEHWLTASQKGLLARQLRRKGDHLAARALQQEALATLASHLGAEHPKVGVVENSLALTLLNLGDLEGALPHLSHSLEILERTLEPDNPTLAFTWTNLSRLRLDLGDPTEGLRLCRLALEQRERVLSPNHPHVGYTLVDCGAILRRLGRHEEAMVDLRRARAIASAQGDPKHPGLASSLAEIGATLLDMEQPADAIESLERAVAVYDRPATEYGAGERSIAEFLLGQALWLGGDDRARARRLVARSLLALKETPAASAGVLARDLARWRAWVAANMQDANPVSTLTESASAE
ncbi:MAG: tetratricopeptide repeat protein [Myxococcota bacterium]